jgi:hypothetical protein
LPHFCSDSGVWCEGSQRAEQSGIIKKDRIMSAGFIAAIVYFLMAVFVLVAFCRAAARGDRPMDHGRSA